MNKDVIVQFMGFSSKPTVREYLFTVREPAMEPREFTLAIPNEAFNPRGLRFQDAPDVCSIKLHHELAAHANHPPVTHFDITAVELEDYRSSHAPAQPKSPFARKPVEDF
ncbi:MAG TPA: hypothetical protein VHX36_08530 [Candidatus Acidoferrales bacterium]|jgi:hypothetical protein|nr:hypothetical protein [Candidatus Acidoferrales bacterium]